MVQLIADALLEHQGSGRQALIRGAECGELEVSPQAAYGKLRRIPIGLSNAFLAHTTDRLQQVFPPAAQVQLPGSLQAQNVIVIDGKKIKNAAKRLKLARGDTGSPLGAKSLAALNLRSGLIIAMNSHLDGETNDAPLIPGLLPQVRERMSQRRLFIADSQFCDLIQPRRFQEEGDHFLVRYHPKTHFYPDPEWIPNSGLDVQQRSDQQEWGWLGAPSHPQRLFVRRVTLQRPGEDDLILVTDLLQPDQSPASDLLEAYRLRWSIERVFQQATEVYYLESLISSSPQGMIFQCAFCMVLYNLIQVTRGYIAAAQQREAATISSELLFYDIHRELIALHTLAERGQLTVEIPRFDTAEEIVGHLVPLFQKEWKKRWIKSTRKRNPNRQRRKSPSPAAILRSTASSAIAKDIYSSGFALPKIAHLETSKRPAFALLCEGGHGLEGAAEAEFIEITGVICVNSDSIKSEIGNGESHGCFFHRWFRTEQGINPDSGVFRARTKDDSCNKKDHFSRRKCAGPQIHLGTCLQRSGSPIARRCRPQLSDSQAGGFLRSDRQIRVAIVVGGTERGLRQKTEPDYRAVTTQSLFIPHGIRERPHVKLTSRNGAGSCRGSHLISR